MADSLTTPDKSVPAVLFHRTDWKFVNLPAVLCGPVKLSLETSASYHNARQISAFNRAKLWTRATSGRLCNDYNLLAAKQLQMPCFARHLDWLHFAMVCAAADAQC